MYEPVSAEAEMRKERRCLMCANPFMSEWPGERVCRACKGKAAWREGSRWPADWPPWVALPPGPRHAAYPADPVKRDILSRLRTYWFEGAAIGGQRKIRLAPTIGHADGVDPSLISCRETTRAVRASARKARQCRARQPLRNSRMSSVRPIRAKRAASGEPRAIDLSVR